MHRAAKAQNHFSKSRPEIRVMAREVVRPNTRKGARRFGRPKDEKTPSRKGLPQEMGSSPFIWIMPYNAASKAAHEITRAAFGRKVSPWSIEGSSITMIKGGAILRISSFHVHAYRVQVMDKTEKSSKVIAGRAMGEFWRWETRLFAFKII